MSAFIVDVAHVDALLRAGIEMGRESRLSWLDNEPEEATDREPGEPWGTTAVVNHTRRRRELTVETCNEIGRMLLMANARSVAYRYNEPIAEDTLQIVFPASRVLKASARRYTPVEILKAIACFEYQACEPPTWETSEAHEFCEALRRAAINRLDGYDAAAWEIRD